MHVFINKVTAFLLLTIFFFLSFPALSSGLEGISYSEAGSGEPIILIHAFPTDKQLWYPQQEILKKNFRVITLDLWGFGASAGTHGEAMSMQSYAEEVKILMNNLHIPKAIIGGESMGGYVALTFLKNYPDNVTGLILSNTQSIADNEITKQKRETLAQQVLANGPAQLINDFMPKALSDAASAKTRSYLLTILNAQSTTGIASALRGMAIREDTSDVLAATNLPILIITSDHDTLVPPEQSQKMHALAKNSKLANIANAGHLSSLEQPEKWSQAVLDMFGS